MRSGDRRGSTGKPRRIAIADDQPTQQYLYPESLLARLLRRHQFEAHTPCRDEPRTSERLGRVRSVACAPNGQARR